MNDNSRKTWQYPWGYKESFLIVLELLLLGFIVEVLSGNRGFTGISWPFNLIAGLLLIILIVLIHIFFRKHAVIKWLSSVPAAISAISFFTFLVFLLGFIPQGNPHAHPVIRSLGLNHVKNSWIFIISSIYLLTCLGLVALRRARPLNRRNIGFLLNHTGLWIALAAGGLGSGDLRTLVVELNEETGYTNRATDQYMMIHELPFSMKLIDFRIDEYLPKIGIFSITTGELISSDGRTVFTADEEDPIEFGSWTINITKFIPDATSDSGYYIASDMEGTAPAVFVEIKHFFSDTLLQGWLSSGSYVVPAKYLLLDNEHVIVMLKPEAERFCSEIVVDNGVRYDTILLEVNRPHKVRGYNLYQLSYDEQMGKWSKTSVVEAVKDPWLPYVYVGIFMLLAGAAYIFWIGNEPKKNTR